MRIEHDVSLQRWNTFGVAARAASFVRLASLDEVIAFAADTELSQHCMILGGGSNILVHANVPGVVAHIGLRGIDPPRVDAGDDVLQRAAAGESWHTLVMHTLKLGLGGLENLSLIPGNVGAAPIQNIGAYGVELKDLLHSVDAVDLRDGRLRTLGNADCAFGYRDSIFKGAQRGRYIICAVTLRLSRRPALMLDYRGVREELAALGVNNPDIRSVSQAVCNIRRRKLPDPALLGNAGSFFRNPLVETNTLQRLLAVHNDLPHFPQASGCHKLAAAWLIEQAGWKGYREGDVGVHRDHALVLVNYGDATGAALVNLAARMQASVLAQFGIRLEPEPEFVPALPVAE